MTPKLMADVLIVHQCEEAGNWHVHGPTYWGGLGWSTGLFAQVRSEMGPAYRGMPLRGDLASPYAQGREMLFFVRHEMHGRWPAEVYGYGCQSY